MEANYSIPLNESELVVYDSTIFRVLWIISMVVMSITFFLGILGNGLVIWVAGFRMAYTVTTICYLNLALADFSFTATLPFLLVQMAMNEKWPFGWFLCKLVNIVGNVNLFGSIFLIAVIALDRCIFVLHPVWAQNHRTVSLARKVVVGLWILALILTIPIFIFMTTVTIPGGHVYCTFSFASWVNTAEEEVNAVITFGKVNGIITFIIGFSMPMSVIIICYGLIAVKMHRRALVNSSRPLRVLKTVVASFFICWFPFQLVALLNTIRLKESLVSGDYKNLFMLLKLTNSLAYFNSCLNPMLYVFMGRNFRERLIHSLPSSLERALSEDTGQISDTGINSGSPPTDIEIKAI